MVRKPIVSIEPCDVNIDPKKGFTGFMHLPGELRGDEYRAIERFVRICQEKEFWAPITVRRFMQYVDIENTLNILVREGYLVVDGSKIKPTVKLIKETYRAFPASRTPSEELLYQTELEKLSRYVQNVIDHDPDFEVRFVIFGRVYNRRCRVMKHENLMEKLSDFGPWLDHGFMIVNVATIDRKLPLGPQLPKIYWETPIWRIPKP